MDAAEANETIKNEAESLIAHLKSGTVDEDFCTTRSREFQDGILRSSSCKFEW